MSCFSVLLGFTGFLRDLLDFIWFYWVFHVFYWFLPEIFCSEVLDYRVLLGFKEFFLVFTCYLPGFTGFYWFLLGFTGFHSIFN